MKVITHCIILAFFISSCTTNQPDSTNLDFSGMDEFWKITSMLVNNVEPDEENWNALFDTPGYFILTQSEFTKEYFKNYFKLAYMPNKKEFLQRELQKSHWRIQYLKHMTKVLSEKEKIQKHREELTNTNYLTMEAQELAKEYLPNDYYNFNDLPQISFLIFGNDARSYSNMIIDILYSVEQGNKLKYLVGHETHHFYRNKRLKFEFPEQSHSDYNLIWILNQLQAEGIADQIDKRIRYFNGGDQETSKWALSYKDYYNKTPGLIREIDSLLTEYHMQSKESNLISDKIRKIVPMSGHPTGYFMANAIIETLGKHELLECVDNPFKFIKLYNQAAANHLNEYPTFSKESVELIDKIELKYLIK